MILILGARLTGKSRWAEQRARQSSRKRHYVATMQPNGPECEEIIRRHRAQRAADGYITHEVYGSLAELSFDSTDLVLVEDVSNLLANLLFTEKLSPETALEQAVRELMQLADNGAEVILVSLCCGLDEGDNDETRQYISALNSLNARLFGLMDEVVELRDGKAHWLKG